MGLAPTVSTVGLATEAEVTAAIAAAVSDLTAPTAASVLIDNVATEAEAGTYTTPTLTGPVTGSLTVTVDGGTPGVVPVSALSVADTAAALITAVGSTGTVTHDSTTITVTSATTGASSSVQLVADSGAQSAGFEADSGVQSGADVTYKFSGLPEANPTVQQWYEQVVS